jgi:hypothetical protein
MMMKWIGDVPSISEVIFNHGDKLHYKLGSRVYFSFLDDFRSEKNVPMSTSVAYKDDDFFKGRYSNRILKNVEEEPRYQRLKCE